jgi:TolA-binding protein
MPTSERKKRRFAWNFEAIWAKVNTDRLVKQSPLHPGRHRTVGFMPRARAHFVCWTLFWILCAGVSPTGETARAADLSSAFFDADGCARALRKDPAAQKLRHNWERCIDKFQAVYRQDARGPWAPASLFQSGVLYRDLSRFSRSPADEKKAVESFDQIQKRFPDSAYRERAAAELQKMNAPAAREEKPARTPAREKTAAVPAAPKDPPAAPKKSSAEARGYQSAEACFQQLRRGKPTEANRREWMLCIGRSRNVYLENPTGEWVAASLYMEGMLYYDLHKGLKFNSDLKAAQENFEKIVKEHPDSQYAAKAAKELQGMPRPWAPSTAARRPAPPPAGGAEPPAAAAPKPTGPASKPAPDDEGLAVVQELRHWSNPDYTRVVVYADR